MKIIECLSKYIDEEIADAEKYAKKAIEVRETDKTLADNLFELSAEEMRHSQILHAQVTRIIADYRKEKGEPPAAMLAVYDYLHKKHIDKAAQIKVMQKMFSE